jgi:hypothetical protein
MAEVRTVTAVQLYGGISAIAAAAAESSERLLLRTEQPLLGFC